MSMQIEEKIFEIAHLKSNKDVLYLLLNNVDNTSLKNAAKLRICNYSHELDYIKLVIEKLKPDLNKLSSRRTLLSRICSAYLDELAPLETVEYLLSREDLNVNSSDKDYVEFPTLQRQWLLRDNWDDEKLNKLTKMLENKGANWNFQRKSDKYNILHQIIMDLLDNGNYRRLSLDRFCMICQKVDLDAENKDGKTPLELCDVVYNNMAESHYYNSQDFDHARNLCLTYKNILKGFMYEGL